MTEEDMIKKLKSILTFMRRKNTSTSVEEDLGIIYGQLVELLIDLEDHL